MNTRTLFLLPPLLALSLACLPLHARQAIVLQQQMDAETFQKTGLDKLSPAELEQLQQWLSAHAGELASVVPASEAHSATAASAARKETAAATGWFGLKKATGDKSDRVVVSPVAGDFQGWHAGTVIALQNGQKWRVVEGSLVASRPMEAPEATVKPAMAGTWFLKVKGYNSSARVEPAN